MRYILLAATALALAVPAAAVPMTFFGEDLGTNGDPLAPRPNSTAAEIAFLANLSGVSTESFETIAAGTVDPALTFVGSAGLITATLSGGMEVDDTNFQTFATTGTHLLEGFSDAFVVTFDVPVAAFGFYATDIGDFAGQLSLQFDGGAPVMVPHTIGVGGSTDGAVLYFGYIDTDAPFTTVTFLNSDTSDFFGFDDLTVGDVEQVVPVPAPGAVGLLGIGLLGLGVLRRRR